MNERRLFSLDAQVSPVVPPKPPLALIELPAESFYEDKDVALLVAMSTWSRIEFCDLASAGIYPEDIVMPGETYARWMARILADKSRKVVPITFLYHRLATLVISIQEHGSGHYYDFGSKSFVLKPQVPRAALTQLGMAAPLSHFYGAVFGRSAKLHGQYVVTVRDTDHKGVIVALLSYEIDNNELVSSNTAAGLEGFIPEKNLPTPDLGVVSTIRAGRAVELD